MTKKLKCYSTLANDGVLRVWVTAGLHELDIVVLHTTIDLNGAIPESPSLAVRATRQWKLPAAQPDTPLLSLPDSFCGAISALLPFEAEKSSHSLNI